MTKSVNFQYFKSDKVYKYILLSLAEKTFRGFLSHSKTIKFLKEKKEPWGRKKLGYFNIIRGKKRMRMNKRGGMELSMTTIVIIVISIIILIFGIIFGRNIMCSGIRITDQIDTAVKNQLRDLFGSDKIGVSCQGEEGSEVKLATGKKVSIVCQIKVEEPTSYRIAVDDPQMLLGNERTKAVPKSWILTKGINDAGVKPGSISYIPVLLLNVPKDTARSMISVDMKVYDKGSADPNAYETHTVRFELVPLNFIQTTMC